MARNAVCFAAIGLIWLAACSALPSPFRIDCDRPLTDIATEPEWRQFADYREWATADGCLVRIDVIADRAGPEHCGFQDARVIVTGNPFGARYTDSTNAVNYVRDPNNVFNDAATAEALELDAQLPDGAQDTGLREGGTALWIDPADDSVIYLVTPEAIERWPRDPQPAGCA